MNTKQDTPTTTEPAPTSGSDNVSVDALAAMLAVRNPDSTGGAGSPSTAGEPEGSEPPPGGAETAGKPEIPDSGKEPPQPPAPETEEEAPKEEPLPREFEYPKFQKRVDELTARLRRAEEELAKLKGKPEESPAEPTTPALPTVEPARGDTIPEIDQKIKSAWTVIQLQAEHPDGYLYRDAEGKEHDLSADDLRRMTARAICDLAELTARREALLAREQVRREAWLHGEIQRAATQYPWLRQPESPQYQEALRLVRDNPGLLNRPDVVWLLAGAVESLTRKALAAASSGTPSRPAPKLPTRPERGAGAGPVDEQRLRDLEQRVEAEGSVQAFQALLAAKAAARQKAAA